MGNKLGTLALTLCFLALLAWRSGAFSSRPSLEEVLVGKPAPALQGKLSDSVTVAGYLGHVTVLNVWATWCPPCLAELPEIQRRYKALHTAHGQRFQLVGVTGTYQQEDPAEYAASVAQWVQKKQLTYPQLLDERQLTLQAFQVRSFPTSILIGPDGRVASVGLGPMGTARVLLEAEALLTRTAVETNR